MSTLHTIWALTCVFAIACGQLLFKKAGSEIQHAGTWFDTKALLFVGVAGILYGVTTILWISLLRYVPLNKAYNYMSLSFILVPIASTVLFREPITTGAIVGGALVVAGIIVVTRFG